MSKESLIEEEMTFFGLDERAAEAIAAENDGIHNKSTIIERAANAQDKAADAA
jgi:hypothetical protein